VVCDPTQLPPAPCAMHAYRYLCGASRCPAAARAGRGYSLQGMARRSGRAWTRTVWCAQPSGRQLPGRGRGTPYAPCQVCWHWQHSAVRTTAAEPSPVAVQPATPLSRVRLTSCTLLLGRSTEYVRTSKAACGRCTVDTRHPPVRHASVQTT